MAARPGLQALAAAAAASRVAARRRTLGSARLPRVPAAAGSHFTACRAQANNPSALLPPGHRVPFGLHAPLPAAGRAVARTTNAASTLCSLFTNSASSSFSKALIAMWKGLRQRSGHFDHKECSRR